MLEKPVMFDCDSFLILICELTLEVAHIGGDATVVVRFDDGVQMNVGVFQKIRIGDVLMSLVGGVRGMNVVGVVLMSFVGGVRRVNVVGVVLLILVLGARILGVGWLIL